MPIQLIDNFELNVQKPIDNRFVVGGTSSFYATRFDIVNAYHGLRIWDLNDGQPYVYDGSTWSSEATLTTIQGNGTANYLPKFNTSNSIEDSIIYQNSGNIIIGTTSIGSPSAKLVVDGNIKANSGYYYYGSGLYLTALNATEITTGTLDLARLSISSSSSGWIMSRNSSSANWINPNSLTVATASALETTRTLWGQNFNGTSNVSGNITVNGGVLAITGAVQFKNSNNGFLNVVYGGTSNINRTYTIPGSNGNRTFALLEHSQTFLGQNTFGNFTFLNNNIQVTGTSSFKDELEVDVTAVLNFPPPIGPVSLTTKPLKVEFNGVKVGNTTGNPYISLATNAYTFNGDTDTGIFRVATSGSTMSSLRLLNDNRIQMILGNNISATYSTSVEQYSTPGIAMMSLLDVFSIVSFNAATYGAGSSRFVWLTNSPWSASITAISLPYTNTGSGLSGPGVAAAASGINAENYDRLVSVHTGGETSCFLHLETFSGSGVYYISQTIWKDCQYSMIIPAGRKWKLCAYRNVSNSTIIVSGSPVVIPPDVSPSDDVQVFIYKYGMS